MKAKTTKDFDKAFDDGGDVISMLDLSKAKRGSLRTKNLSSRAKSRDLCSYALESRKKNIVQ